MSARSFGKKTVRLAVNLEQVSYSRRAPVVQNSDTTRRLRSDFTVTQGDGMLYFTSEGEGVNQILWFILVESHIWAIGDSLSFLTGTLSPFIDKHRREST